MIRYLAFAILLIAFPSALNAQTAGDAKRGGEIYRACVACHALEPDLHLSGPSLDGVMNRVAGTANGYERFSQGLKDAEFDWNTSALDGWLKNPLEMIPGTYMNFRGIEEPQARADLIAFLNVAGQKDGGRQAVEKGLIPVAWLRGAAPQSVADAPLQARVSAVRHCGDSYFIKTEDGRETPFWEKNVRLKIDSRPTGPPSNVAVIVRSGMQGDRVSVIFATVDDMKNRIAEKC